jgi:hypothetical protein
MALLGHYVDVVLVKLALHDFGEIKLSQLIPVICIIKHLDGANRFLWPTGIILTNVTVGCTGHQRVGVSPGQPLHICIPDRYLQV